MYELIILSILMGTNAHGYLIAKIINDMLGPFAKVSNGRLYPLMSKMVKDGLIEPEVASCGQHDGGRQINSFRITEAGRKQFHQKMLEIDKQPGEYQKLFLQKVAAFSYITPEERLKLIDHYIHYCEAHILHLRQEADDLRDNKQDLIPAERLENTLEAMQHLIEQWQLELKWAKSLRAKNASLVD
jgi:DNA-binding PadR family transcriptional regulator